MDILLDTHVFLWWEARSKQLPEAIRQSIETPVGNVFISVASIWEIAIKRAKGNLALSGPIESAIEASGFSILPIMANHAETAGGLPTHHADPFDRMLVAQAMEEKLVLATVDDKIMLYNVPQLRK